MSDEVLTLIPFQDSYGAQVHPSRDGDVVSEVFIDRRSGRKVLILRDPEMAHQLGVDMLKATTDPDIAAEADRVREAQ